MSRWSSLPFQTSSPTWVRSFGDLAGLGLLEEVLALWLRSTSKVKLVSPLTDAGPGEAAEQDLDSRFISLTALTPSFSPHLSCLLHSLFGTLPTEMETWKKNNSGWGGGEIAESVCGITSTPLAHSPAGRKIFLLRDFSTHCLKPWSGPKGLCEVCFETTPSPTYTYTHTYTHTHTHTTLSTDRDSIRFLGGALARKCWGLMMPL